MGGWEQLVRNNAWGVGRFERPVRGRRGLDGSRPKRNRGGVIIMESNVTFEDRIDVFPAFVCDANKASRGCFTEVLG